MDDEESEFARMMPGVKRLQQDRFNLYRHREQKAPPLRAQQPTPTLRQDAAAGAAQGMHFNTGLQKKLQRRIRQGLIRPEASLDLHGCRQREAHDLLRDFVAEATRQQLRMILIIHGQGFRSQQDAVLKPLVQRWLADQPAVLAWCPAQPRDGAAGATYVYLRTD